jgi:hypothetical protein
VGLETYAYINSFVVTNPTASDPKSAGDDHLRGVKYSITYTFPNITGAVTVTHTQLNSVVDRGLIAGQTWTGTHTFPATTYGVTAAFGASGTAFATLDYVNAVATSAALPGQTSNAGKWLVTNGTTASWTDTHTIAMNEAKGADIASAATINLTTATGNLVHVTGTTTITAITIPVGAERTVIFDGALTLTHGAALLLPGAANIVTAANDRMVVRGDTAGAIVVEYTKATGYATVFPIQYLTCTSTLTKTSDTALANIPGFSATLVSGGTYQFTMQMYGSSANNGGVSIGFSSGSATATSFIAGGVIPAAGGTGSFFTTAIGTPISSIAIIGTAYIVTGTFVCNAGGTFVIQYAQAASFGTPSIVLANSTFTIERIS